ncbi:MAG: hypothetical protein AB8B56_05415 [Crocinitomicaceae bacterium]
MKKATGIKFTALLMLFMGMTLFSKADAQTTSWTFDAGDNSGYMVQVKTTGRDHAVSAVNLAKKGDANWTKTSVQHIDDYDTYIRVKSLASGRVYEIEFDWYDDKLVVTMPEGTTRTYWLRKS